MPATFRGMSLGDALAQGIGAAAPRSITFATGSTIVGKVKKKKKAAAKTSSSSTAVAWYKKPKVWGIIGGSVIAAGILAKLLMGGGKSDRPLGG